MHLISTNHLYMFESMYVFDAIHVVLVYIWNRQVINKLESASQAGHCFLRLLSAKSCCSMILDQDKVIRY